jgi:hypothetical protein
MTPQLKMTWAEFVEKVDKQLADKGLTRDVPLSGIDWDRDGFGGVALPGVFVNSPDAEGYVHIGED